MANGYANAGNAIGQLIGLIAGGGGNLRTKAQAEGALMGAQTYAHNMHGNKYGEEARGLRMTNDNRVAIPQMIAVDTSMPQYKKDMLQMFQLMGGNPGNPDQLASAGQRFQEMGYRDAAVQNPAIAGQIAQAAIAANGGQLYRQGDAGTVVNSATGETRVGAPGLYNADLGVKQAQANQHNQHAGYYGAQRQGKVLENQLQTMDNEAARQGLTLPSKGPGGGDKANYNVTGLAAKAFSAPVLDKQGRPVLDVLTQKPMMTHDPAAQEKFSRWALANNKTNWNYAVAEWLASGRPDAPAPLNVVGAQGGPSTQAVQDSGGVIDRARSAIANGAPRDQVINRLRQMGIDPAGL